MGAIDSINLKSENVEVDLFQIQRNANVDLVEIYVEVNHYASVT